MHAVLAILEVELAPLLAVQALHALLKTLDAALAPVPGLSKHNYGVSQHGFCVSAGLTGRCDDHAAAALDAALRLREAARQVGV